MRLWSRLGFTVVTVLLVFAVTAFAAAWLRRAADQGLADAQFILGLMYYQGEGVAKDEQEAAAWIRRAADQGLALAQFTLGLMYYEGKGVPKDEQEAVVWYRRAADQGLALAQAALQKRQ